jgi:oligopeptide/dipeptide ABC transporter ATP-binding protein
MNGNPLLQVKSLRLSVRTDEGLAQILDHVELDLPRGNILGVVGESGCGKSTLARAVLGIIPNGALLEGGEIRFEGEDLLGIPDRDMTRRIRGRRIGFIPQDPYLALNPVFKIGSQLLSMLRWHAPPDLRSESDRRRRVLSLLSRVQIAEPELVLERYPHQFSGGQRQRLMIAGALACSPALVVADEPTTALDVTTQLQILTLLRSLTEEFGIAMLFVTHDLGVVAELCDAVTVMYAGQTVETGRTKEVLAAPQHPYTKALLACHPDRSGALIGIQGLVPSPLAPPPGCRFTPRCSLARAQCGRRTPRLVADAPGHLVSCRLADERQRERS